AQGFYDEVTIHPYCYPSNFSGDKYVQSPEESNLDNNYRVISRLAGGLPVGNGEFGFSIDQQEALGSQASRRMADYMLRSYLLTAACPEARRIMWYTVAGNYDSYSVWKWPHPRPLVAAYANLAQLLDKTTNPEELQLGSLVRGLLLSKETASLAALWCPSEREVEFALPVNSGIRILDSMGNPLNEAHTLTLSGSPLFFLYEQNAAQLTERLKAGKLLIQPVQLQLRIENQNSLKLLLTNQQNEELAGKIQLQVPLTSGAATTLNTEFSRLRPGKTEILTLALPAPLDITALSQGHFFTGVVSTKYGEIPVKQKLELLPCHNVSDKITIDGFLHEWQELPAIELNSSLYLFPPDAASHSLWRDASDLGLKVWLGWNQNYFYFAARVYDDVHINKQSAQNVWAEDCIQMAFDTLNDAMSTGYNDDDREFNLSLSKLEKQAVIGQSWPPPSRIPEGCLLAAQVSEGYIDYELAIPFAALKPLQAVTGSVFAYNFVATDVDVKRIDYWMGLTYGICGGKNPSVFKKFILLPPWQP
ncbi:MAG: sugar-binding protein, partial [Lentisphaeria bacterium]